MSKMTKCGAMGGQTAFIWTEKWPFELISGIKKRKILVGKRKMA